MLCILIGGYEFYDGGHGDEAQYLSRNVDGIMARLLYNADLQKMMGASKVPVINGCDVCIIQANVSLT
jgi:hypothetical protein